MRRYIPVFILLAVVGLFLLFRDVVIVRGSGKISNEVRSVSGFTRVVLSGSGEVILTQGDEESLRIEAEDNILPYLKSTVSGDTLNLGQDWHWPKIVWPTKTIKYYIGVKSLHGVTISGSGKVQTEKLETDSLELKISGSGKITIGDLTSQSVEGSISGSGDFIVDRLSAETLSITISGSGNCSLGAGHVTDQKVSISGSGDFKAAKLESLAASVKISGSGDVTVWAAETLDVHISGSGNVSYYGSPQVNSNVAGSGKVKRQGNP
jgi:hypothetical protein